MKSGDLIGWNGSPKPLMSSDSTIIPSKFDWCKIFVGCWLLLLLLFFVNVVVEDVVVVIVITVDVVFVEIVVVESVTVVVENLSHCNPTGYERTMSVYLVHLHCTSHRARDVNC